MTGFHPVDESSILPRRSKFKPSSDGFLVSERFTLQNNRVIITTSKQQMEIKMSERIVIEINTELQALSTGEMLPIKRAVVRSSAIVGLTEDLFGRVRITIKATPTSEPKLYYILNSFDEVAEFMCR
ncbi:hypothetical protein [Serratia phage X20]|uniref:Uncharacterized protein n=1 Tax=Serratia phage X20 TaxID=2006942 RepID=A0A1Z1LZ73_9CAUD|nr:hypothetical protein KNT72_gp273 [Serratia phage X20]ARW58115.1 hypothetical protein [Serratia phage X20]